VKQELILGCLVMAVFSSCSHLGQSEQPSSSPRADEIRAAMNRTVIPEIDLENVKAEDALKYWQETSRTYHPQHFKFVHVMSYPTSFTVPGATGNASAVVPHPRCTR